MAAFPEPTMIRTNGIDMAVYEAGPQDGLPVVLCHGFPELAYSWRHQLPALAAAGYRAIAPDQRGYGSTSRPERVEEYDMAQLTGVPQPEQTGSSISPVLTSLSDRLSS